MVTAWSGTSENPVIRSKFRRIRRNRLYLDFPRSRSLCPTSISTGLTANFWASAGMKVVLSAASLMMSTTSRR